MASVVDRLQTLPFFNGFDRSTLDMIAEYGCWHSVAGGWRLFDQGATSERLYFLLSGRLVVIRKEDGEGDEAVIGYVRAGEPVGEMALLTGDRHSASVFALRDSEVLSIERRDFAALLDDHADLVGALAKLALQRARGPLVGANALSARSAPRIFAVVASSPSIDPNAHAEALARRIDEMGLRVLAMPVKDTAPDSYEFDRIEERHDIVILAARVVDTSWYRFVLRHADRFLVLARRDARPPRPFPLVTAAGERARKFRLVDLVVLHEGPERSSVADWLDALSAARVFHCRGQRCVDRLARVIAGRSVGMVLSGGGARAYAHIGAVKALREYGVPIDLACGASMGGIIAACVAMGWSSEEIEERIKDAFVSSNPLGDYVLPVVAMTRGKRVEERLAKHFGDSLIEQIELPFFCVSSELTRGEAKIHRRGLLRDALRASVSLPGVMPPVVREDHLFVDGAVINNFPTDIMSAMHRGLTIGVDVARRGTISAEAFIDPPNFFQWVFRHGLSAPPPIVPLLMRSATARANNDLQHRPDIAIAPAVRGVELRDWKKYDQAVADGYTETRKALDQYGPLLEIGQQG